MPQPVTQVFSREAVAVPEVRSLVRQTLDLWGITERSDDMLTCVFELSANAVRHDETLGATFLVTMSGHEGLLRIEVHDASRRCPQLRSPDVESTSGRGLLLVNELADGWGVEPRNPRGKIVWTEFKVAAMQAPASPC